MSSVKSPLDPVATPIIEESEGSEIGRAASGPLTRSALAADILTISDVAALNRFAVAGGANDVCGEVHHLFGPNGPPLEAVRGAPVMTFGG